MDTFESGTKTIMNQPSTLTLQTADHELLLLSEVNKLMGGTLTLDKFGEKPLKLLPSSSPVHISDD